MEVKYDINTIAINEFIDFLRDSNINRFYFVYNAKTDSVEASHPELEDVAKMLDDDKRDFQNHEGLFFVLTEKYPTLLGAFIHNTTRGQAAGGTRFWNYNNFEDFIRDGMRLSKGMTRKNALAGLWWGGGKGVMSRTPGIDYSNPEIRKYIYNKYGEFISTLNGCYVTAEDVGTSVVDMANIFSKTRFVTCIPKEYGGSGNPSSSTARGVVAGMEAALEYKGMGDLKGKVIAIQGLGNVARNLVGFLVDKGVEKIIAVDINDDNVALVNEKWPDIVEARVVGLDDLTIFSTECDILSPNATGGVLNPITIPMLNTPIICGASNNQLEDSNRDDKLLFDRGIIYIPDFLNNRMGIVNCANEQYGYVDVDTVLEDHMSKDWKYSINQMAIKMMEKSDKMKIPTAEIAILMADEEAKEEHPIYGHRGKKIIDSLVRNGWEKS